MASAGTSVCDASSAIEAHLPEVDLESRGVPEDIDQFTQSTLRDLREPRIQPFALGFRAAGDDAATLNPPDKRTKRTWAPDDMLVVLAED